MKEYIRIVQTDGDEIHEDKTNVKYKTKAEKDVIKDLLKTKMTSGNYKYQRHICDHDEPNRKGCKLEDI